MPDESGRIDILNIHTIKMREHNKLSDNVDLHKLATLTRNYSGAELEGLVRSATSTAMNRIISVCYNIQLSVCVVLSTVLG